MSKVSVFASAALSAVLFLPAAGFAQTAAPAAPAAAPAAPHHPAPRDWATWGYDQQRSNWNRGETTLSKANVGKLQLLWSSKVAEPADVVLSTLTAPLVVEKVATPAGPKDLVFTLSGDNILSAVDADSGKIVWQKSFPPAAKPLRASNWLCPNAPNDTPVYDRARGLVFFMPADGKLRAVSAGDGVEKMQATQLVAPFARAWSLNLIEGVVYTTSARGCGNLVDPHAPFDSASIPTPPPPGRPPSPPNDPGLIAAADVHDLDHPQVTHFFTSTSRSNGPWGRGGVARVPGGIITQTADGPIDPAAGNFGNTVLKLAPRAVRLMDSFTATNWKFINQYDLDLGSGSVIVFPAEKRTIAASVGKEGVIHLLDTDNLGGADHATPHYRSPRYGNDANIGTMPGMGMWGAMATYVTPEGKRYLYMPMWGPPSKEAPAFKFTQGETPNGSIMAFEVVSDGGKLSLSSAWMSPNMTVPDVPVVANGVVYATQTGEQTLQAKVRAGDGPPEPPGPGAGAAFRATPVSNLILYAFDAETGKTLYSSKKLITNWTHFSEPVVALGKVFLVTHDGQIHAFGLKK
jgi:outer membrane protein assembly factor BamB